MKIVFTKVRTISGNTFQVGQKANLLKSVAQAEIDAGNAIKDPDGCGCGE